jgi:hypothetical protein
MIRPLLAGCVVALSFAFTGCGSSLVKVTGKVTIDGQPLTTGNISFAPVESGQVAIGTIDGQGNYTMQSGTVPGVAPGKYKVTIVAVEAVAPVPGQPEAAPKLLTPAKYNNPDTSELTADVSSTQKTFDFNLKSMP